VHRPCELVPDAPRPLAFTPVGGLALIAGWAVLAKAALG
jgi:uncharacterized membrane protein YgdD (TMEM256/DUF423 family)